MATGADHYQAAEDYLLNASEEIEPAREAYLLAVAQVHATLAVAAATAMEFTLRLMGGDSHEVTAWARLVQPDEPRRSYDEESAWRRFREVTRCADVAVDESPKQPRRGDIWMDSFGRRWLVQIATVPINKLWLVCLDSHMTEDFFAGVADEYGPMRLWHRPQLAEDDEEVPF